MSVSRRTNDSRDLKTNEQHASVGELDLKNTFRL